MKCLFIQIITFSIILISCEPNIIEVNSEAIINLDDFSVYNKSYHWNENEEQIQYFTNGNIEIEYVKKEDKIIRRTFSEYGLETEIEIIQNYGVDTFWQINPVTLEDEQIISRGIKDVYVGLYSKYRSYRFENYYWNDEKQIAYWKNGNLRTKYVSDNNQQKIRQDYDLDGLTLIRSAKVKQINTTDTTWQINALTLEDEMIIEKGYIDS